MIQSEQFLQAVQKFKMALPELRQMLLGQFAHPSFQPACEQCFLAFSRFLKASYQQTDQFGIFARLGDCEPDCQREQVVEFLVQIFLLEPFLRLMFPSALGQNSLAREVDLALSALENREWLRMSVDGYYFFIEREVRGASSVSARQQILNTVCEQFFNGYDPQRSEELGVFYTPLEIVEFMCASCEQEVKTAYGRDLSSKQVPILDPACGVGVFLLNILNRLSLDSLPYKYAHELFGIELMLTPYFVALLNIEQGFFDRTGYYQAFPGLRYADALLT